MDKAKVITALFIAKELKDPFVAITLEELYNDRKRLIAEVERLREALKFYSETKRRIRKCR